MKACLSLVNVCLTYVSEKEGFHCVFVWFCSARSYVSTSLWFMAHSYKGILLPCNYIFFCIFLVLFGCIRSTPQHCPSLPLSLLWLSSAASFPLLSPENVARSYKIWHLEAVLAKASWNHKQKWPYVRIKFKTSPSYIMSVTYKCCVISVYGLLALLNFNAAYEVHLATQTVTERISCENRTA